MLDLRFLTPHRQHWEGDRHRPGRLPLGLRSAATLGTILGGLLAKVLAQAGWTRGAVTGGDTSSFAARALGVEALEFEAPIAPGAA